MPEYVVVEALGPDHRRTFRVELRAAGRALGVGEGRSIKIAQQEAARAALLATEGIESILLLTSAECSEPPDEIEMDDEQSYDQPSRSPEQAYEHQPLVDSSQDAMFASDKRDSDEDDEVRGIAATEL